MYTCIIHERNRNSFIRWFTHTSANLRNLFVAAFSDFLWKRGCSNAFIHEVPSLSTMANVIFSEMEHWDIHDCCVYPESLEVTFFLSPHIYFRPAPGKSEAIISSQILKHDSLNP